MISALTFILGVVVGLYLAFRRQVQIKNKIDKQKFSAEIELRAIPDTYLSEFDIIRKRYYEAKFKKMIDSQNDDLA